ncbi:MAG: efflux RND transporter permease subunit, partial [Pseudomonadota bacterium]|nr:efflux RND transporter permease subunit [Pseudomonadota bacterium]
DGASPETIDAEVTSVIEGAVARVSGVKTINAASEENNARIRGEFAPNVDLDIAASDVREAVAAIERDLPEGVEDVTIVKADADRLPVMRLALVSEKLSQESLTRLAEEDLSAELTSIPGVATVELFGDQEQVLRVVVDPIRLASYGLSIDEVANVLSSLSLDVPAGSFKSNDQLLMVRADASVWRPEAVERLAIRNDIKLGDVGQAFYGPAEAESYSLLNGRKVVGIGIVRRAQSNTIAISEAVQEAVERLNRRMRDVELIVISDDAQFIRSSVREVVVSLSIAVLVVIGVIFIFMGALRSTLIPAIAIPIALSGTIAAIWLLGFSINILTLLALVLATGMIVDDAIVVIENIQRQRALGLKPFAASVTGTRQVFFAVLATTATLISVFLPIAFLPSTAGKLFTEFGFVLAVAVGISSFVALSLCPMLASRFPDFGDGDKRTRGLLSRLSALVTAGYQRLLVFTLNARFLVIGSAVVIASVAFAVFPTIDRELLPREDRGAIIIMMQGPDGVGLDYMDRQSARAEALLEPLREKGEITNILSIVGRWDLNRNYIIAPLAPWSERSRSQLEIAKALREPLKAIPGATARVRTPNSLNLRRAGGRVEFTLTGSNYRDIAAAADDFLDVLRERAPELDDLEIEFQQTQPQLSLTVDRRRTEDLGIPIEGIVNTLRAMVDGFEVAELNVEDRSVPVLLESTAGAIDDPSDLKNLFVRAADGTLAPLSSFVSLTEVGVAAELDRAAQKRAIEIEASLPQGYAMQAAVDRIEALASETLPPSIGLHFINEAATLKDTSNEVAITFAIAVLVVLLVL